MASLSLQPLPVPEGSSITFGAMLDNVDLENLTGKDLAMCAVIH